MGNNEVMPQIYTYDKALSEGNFEFTLRVCEVSGAIDTEFIVNAIHDACKDDRDVVLVDFEEVLKELTVSIPINEARNELEEKGQLYGKEERDAISLINKRAIGLLEEQITSAFSGLDMSRIIKTAETSNVKVYLSIPNEGAYIRLYLERGYENYRVVKVVAPKMELTRDEHGRLTGSRILESAIDGVLRAEYMEALTNGEL